MSVAGGAGGWEPRGAGWTGLNESFGFLLFSKGVICPSLSEFQVPSKVLFSIFNISSWGSYLPRTYFIIILLIYLFYLLILLTSDNDIKAHVLNQLPKCLQLARARTHPFHPEPTCCPTAVPKVSLSICPLFYMSLWFAPPYIGMMFSRLLSHDCHVCGALQAGPGLKDSQSPHGRRQISKKAFITWGAGVVGAVMGVA